MTGVADRAQRATAGRRRRARRRARGAGQSLVEFALVFPIFFTMALGVIEFAFVFNAVLAVNFAARDAALLAVEAGSQQGGDCVVLRAVDRAVDAPAIDDRIQRIELYRATPTGVQLGSATVYQRGGTTECTTPDGDTFEIPYTRTANGYPETSRCDVLAGCSVSRPLDHLAVRIVYTHVWVTPLRNFVGGGAGGPTFDRTMVMRMEPVL